MAGFPTRRPDTPARDPRPTNRLPRTLLCVPQYLSTSVFATAIAVRAVVWGATLGIPRDTIPHRGDAIQTHFPSRYGLDAADNIRARQCLVVTLVSGGKGQGKRGLKQPRTHFEIYILEREK